MLFKEKQLLGSPLSSSRDLNLPNCIILLTSGWSSLVYTQFLLLPNSPYSDFKKKGTPLPEENSPAHLHAFGSGVIICGLTNPSQPHHRATELGNVKRIWVLKIQVGYLFQGFPKVPVLNSSIPGVKTQRETKTETCVCVIS